MPRIKDHSRGSRRARTRSSGGERKRKSRNTSRVVRYRAASTPLDKYLLLTEHIQKNFNNLHHISTASAIKSLIDLLHEEQARQREDAKISSEDKGYERFTSRIETLIQKLKQEDDEVKKECVNTILDEVMPAVEKMLSEENFDYKTEHFLITIRSGIIKLQTKDSQNNLQIILRDTSDSDLRDEFKTQLFSQDRFIPFFVYMEEPRPHNVTR